MEKLILVSVDSHAQAPPESWPQHLETRYHEFLPSLREEQAIFQEIMTMFVDRTHSPAEVFDLDGAYRGGGIAGVHQLDVRLAEMDREGIAAEYVYNGDPRFCGMFFQSSNRKYPLDVCEAGVRAYHRWAYDTFHSAQDRLFLIGATGSGPCVRMDDTLAELRWLAEHGFAGTSIPGFTAYPFRPPLFDEHWEPFWSLCEELGLALWIHAGHGEEQGSLGREVTRVHAQVNAAGGTKEEFLAKLTTDVFNGELFSSEKPRRAMWQLMFGGVFDRHPNLKLVMNEVRGDWMPATLRRLDEVYAEHRADLPARRSPGEYWASNGLTCLSFVHKAEVEMRHEIGLETIAFGRDYPHSEGTWPNTQDWMRDAFADVPGDEVRAILGENAIRYFGMDRARLGAIADRIGPELDDITGAHQVDPALVNHFDLRGGYLKPSEGASKITAINSMLRDDLLLAGVRP